MDNQSLGSNDVVEPNSPRKMRTLIIGITCFAIAIHSILAATARIDAVVMNYGSHFVDLGLYTSDGVLDISTKIGPHERVVIPDVLSGEARIYRSFAPNSPPIQSPAKPISSCRFSTRARHKLYFAIQNDKIAESGGNRRKP